jgi:two-component system cell cycle response regulator
MAQILLIEDDTASLELMAYLLKAFGHMVVTANDGEAGLARAQHQSPDLILCDIQMPKLDGLALVAELKRDARLRTVPCIAVTAFAMVGDRDRVLAAGFDGYISKPIQPETFVTQVEGFLTVNWPATPSRILALPAFDSESIASGRASSAELDAPVTRARILIVDNSPNNLEFLSSLFEFSGYAVVAEDHIDGAIKRAQHQPPDLIICDLHLQGESGLDFLRWVRRDARLKHLPFVIISSTSWLRKDQLEALAMGASRFILRPIEPALLLAEVEACLPQQRGVWSPPHD